MQLSIGELFESLPYGPAPESPAEANAWLDSKSRQFGIYLGGRFHAPKTQDWFDTFNPSTGASIAKIAQAGAEDVDAAVSAARDAHPKWWELGPHARSKFLYAIARQIQKHSRMFAVLESMDNGKPIRETRDIDVPLVARHFYYHAGAAQIMPELMDGYQPIGVCGQIIPWNFPLLMLAWKIAPALAMGNTIVLKPAEYTSLTALLFAEICQNIGLPDGVVNIITGDGETGKSIVSHPGIDKIAFTGSTEVGRILRKATAGSNKKLSLELGGKSPYIVFDDADLDSAVEGLVDAIWFNQGQVCCAGSRLLVQEGIADRFLGKLRDRMGQLRIGDPLDKAVDIGALVDKSQLDRVADLVKLGVSEGAELFQCGECPAHGWYYPATLLSNVSPSSTVAQVEIFGPVLVSMTFRTPAEAVEIANNTVYGLASSVWTENISLAHDIASKIKAGVVWVNCTNQFDASAGFGGYRESGFGREGGREGLLEYVKPTNGPSSSHQTVSPLAQSTIAAFDGTSVDRTYKHYIGGKQTRPDGGYAMTVRPTGDRIIAEVAAGNRKDVRNAVEAARSAFPSWSRTSGHARAQILFYLGENVAAKSEELAAAIVANCLVSEGEARSEVEACVERLFSLAAWADKFDGMVHSTPFRGLTYTLNEPIGTVGVVCPELPSLLGFVTASAALLAMGNAVVCVPSQSSPVPAAEFIQVLETSDVPAGVWNVVTGEHAPLTQTIAEHDGLDGVWHFGATELQKLTQELSVGNLKQTWCPTTVEFSEGWKAREFLHRATQVKNIWVPMGD